MQPQYPFVVPNQPLLRRLVVEKPLTNPWNVGIVENALLGWEFVAWAELRELVISRVWSHVDGLG